MKKQLVAAGFSVLCLVLPQKATAASLSQLYFFGDSLSDPGNAFSQVGIPPSPYVNGRFSDGRVWAEYLAKNLGLQDTNFAFGGATTGNSNTITPLLPGLFTQINTFINTNPQADSDALYVIWAGANDYLGERVSNPNLPLVNLDTAVRSLAGVGAKNFLVVNLPNLGDIPGTNGNPIQSNLLNNLTGLHNQGLSSILTTLKQDLPTTKINIFDINALFSQAINSPDTFKFANVSQSCLSRLDICEPQKNKFLFWDNLHPTTYTHQIIARTAARQIRSQYVPEPSLALGMLTLGALGAASVLKRQRHVAALRIQSSKFKIQN
ncbi:PEP-CTERM sorting domain-containing protein [Nostoc sp. CENA543]|uniref:SGNH/GDSL hydrolase family protein n=1 Tax=Nostoc sp. CENA543 TaxID=1869241 RepID=UPI000CA2668A|nr:SGNH/GDSL hydrolase family protein [Nostoc sp. CENA543]AUS99328.1 PEP-CTERM sorting domain-containing protein [Nostoc sp. CENA543]